MFICLRQICDEAISLFFILDQRIFFSDEMLVGYFEALVEA